MPENDVEQLYQSAYRQLCRATRAHSLLNAGHALLQLLILLLSGFLAILAGELLMDLPAMVRTGFWIAALLLTLGYFLKYLFPLLRQAGWPANRDLLAIARRIGRQDPAVQDALINFLQIYQGEATGSPPEFRYLSLRQLYEKFKAADFFNIISFRILRQPLYRLLVLAAGFTIFFLLFPVTMGEALQRLAHPTRAYIQPLPTTLENLSGDLTALKNDDVKLSGVYQGISPDRLWLVVKSEAGADSSRIERLEIPQATGREFSHVMPHVTGSFRYWFEGNLRMAAFRNRPARSDTGYVEVRERPFIRELQARLTFPEYTRLGPRLLPPHNGEITALLGTRVDIEIVADKKLSKAWLQFQDSSVVPLSAAENRAAGYFSVAHNDQYQVHILDAEGISNYEPVKYSVFAQADEKPFVEITKPGQDLDLGAELQIPLVINMRDDFGFSRLQLIGRHVHAGSAGDTTAFSINLPYRSLDQFRGLSEHLWDLTPLYLVPDDYVEYFAEVRDNDRVTGPKASRSKTFIVRLPSLIDIMEHADQLTSEKIEETKDIARDTEELKKKLEEINREMKREQEMSWERKKEIQEQLDRQKQSMEKLDEIQKELEKFVQDLDQQNMLSPETLEKYLEVQKMFQDLATPEMMEAMRQMQEAMEKADMEKLKSAMERFQFSVEEFEKKLERTYELFKQVQLEHKMDELVKMAEKLSEEQQQVNKELENENLDEKKLDQLGNQEKNIEKNTDFFEKQLEDASKEFQESMAEIAKELQKAQEFLEQQQLGEQMQAMQQQMKSGQQEQSRQSGENLQKQLQMLQSMMQNAQQNMTQMQKEELSEAMQKVQQDLLRASFEQENLLRRSDMTDLASSKIEELARRQAQMRENAGNIIKQLVEISKKSFFISPQMNQILSSLLSNIDNALRGLEDHNPRSAGKAQQGAMGNLNQAIMSMQNSMDQLAQSSSGSGFEQFMQQLQQMAGQQGQLNQESMGLFQQQGPGGRLQLSEEGMARLAAQQEMIRRSLQSLNEQAGNRRDVLGRLDELGDEMKKVVDDLKRQQLDRKVIERQQNILSRLLDAQKSVREKEYSKKRQAEREKSVLTQSPPELNQQMLHREDQLRKEMLEALKEGYSTEYKEFIRSYYELLSRQPRAQPER